MPFISIRKVHSQKNRKMGKKFDTVSIIFVLEKLSVTQVEMANMFWEKQIDCKHGGSIGGYLHLHFY